MYEITIKGNTPEELFANLAQMAAVNLHPAHSAVSQGSAAPVFSADPNPGPTVNPAPSPAVSSAPIPTATPTYTLDALARAGAALAQAGKMQEALTLLAKYGVQTVNQLKPEQYGAFATELRALGAQI